MAHGTDGHDADRRRGSAPSPWWESHCCSWFLLRGHGGGDVDALPHVRGVGATERTPRLYLSRQRKLLFVPPDQFVRVTDDVEQVVDALAPGTRQVFDFTNSPALFGFALRYQQPTRYYHVSMAIPLEAQRDLIDDLEASDHRSSWGMATGWGFPSWDLDPEHGPSL